jgi:hypothetical protein
MASNEVIRTWDSVSAAARTLNIPLSEIHNVLANSDGDSIVGGFKWRYIVIDVVQNKDAEEENDEV